MINKCSSSSPLTDSTHSNRGGLRAVLVLWCDDCCLHDVAKLLENSPTKDEKKNVMNSWVKYVACAVFFSSALPSDYKIRTRHSLLSLVYCRQLFSVAAKACIHGCTVSDTWSGGTSKQAKEDHSIIVRVPRRVYEPRRQTQDAHRSRPSMKLMNQHTSVRKATLGNVVHGEPYPSRNIFSMPFTIQHNSFLPVLHTFFPGSSTSRNSSHGLDSTDRTCLRSTYGRAEFHQAGWCILPKSTQYRHVKLCIFR